jgi:hypothetical protein
LRPGRAKLNIYTSKQYNFKRSCAYGGEQSVLSGVRSADTKKGFAINEKTMDEAEQNII